uniref:Uncharacterized protein n=1 Tax=Arundo donax TaxID=35708 RepID=A0A0A9FH91_ARUDO
MQLLSFSLFVYPLCNL